MHHQARPKTAPHGEQLARDPQRDPVQVEAKHAAARRVDESHERDRTKEVGAELAICHPRLPLDVETKREGVDENRVCADKLNVVRACVPKNHSVVKGSFLDLKGQCGCRFELPEAPLIRITDERNLMRA